MKCLGDIFYFVVVGLLVSASISCQHLAMDGSKEYETTRGLDGKEVHIVAYNPHGVATVVEVRRKGAIEQMNRKCGDVGYTIKSEKEAKAGKDDGRTVDSVGTSTLMYLEYVCKG